MLRIFLFLALLALQIFSPADAFAQDMPVDAPAAPAKKKTIYDKATDAQIKEAQAFYDFCTKDDAMLQDYNCQCAASTYLDSRIRLGDKASKREVVRTIGDKCPASKTALDDERNDETNDKGIGAPNTETETPYLDLSDATDAQLNEAQTVFEECKSDFIMSLNHDCRCIASSFLGKRLELGPITSKNNILASFRNICKNVVGTTGYEYTNCMADASYDEYNTERKSICECYARKWAELYEKATVEITSVNKNDMRVAARTICTRSIPRR